MSARLPTEVKRLMVANGVWAVGIGMIIPVNLIYLHRVRHIPLGTTGLLLGLTGLVGLAVLPFVGSLTDRFGPGRLLPLLSVLMAAGEVGMAWAHNATTAIIPMTISGLAQGSSFTVFSARIGELCPDGAQQQRAFAINFTVLNALIGVGSLVSAAVVDVGHPGTFQVLYLIAAATDVLTAGILAGPALHDGESQHADEATSDSPKAGYRELLRRPGLGLLIGVALLTALCGYAAVDSGIPAYGNVVSRVSPRVIALGVTVNTAVIVSVQLFVLRFLRRWRLTRGIVVMGLIWAGCWMLLGLSHLPSSDTTRAVMVLAFGGLFGIGETFMQPTLTPLTNRLAGDELRGRANAVTNGMVSLAFVVSPAIVGSAVAAGLGDVWIGYLVVCALGATFMAVLLGRRIGAVQDRNDEPELDPEPAAAQAV
jgi:MFS family permease